MSRLQHLTKLLFKGYDNSETSSVGTVISDWSPNNIRRLIIGQDYVVVNYFKTHGKFTTLIDRLDLRSYVEKDLTSLKTDPKQVKSILTVLTSNRVLSSVEEIVFCCKGYAHPLLSVDTNLSKLGNGQQSLENRFPRLRHISLVDASVQDIYGLLNQAKGGDILLLEVLKQSGAKIKHLVELNEKTWWRGSALRPKYYSMDNTILADYFNGVKTAYEKKERSAILESTLESKDREAILGSIEKIANGVKGFTDRLDKADVIFKSAPLVSKAEWAGTLTISDISKGIRLELNKNEALIKEFRSINFERVIEKAKLEDVSDIVVGQVQKLQDLTFNRILKNEEEYKRESNQLGVPESMQMLQKLVGILLKYQSYIIFYTLNRYLTRNSLEYVEFFYESFKVQDTKQLHYTRDMVEYCNSHMEYGVARKAMDKIGAVEVTVDKYDMNIRLSNVNLILQWLGSLN